MGRACDGRGRLDIATAWGALCVIPREVVPGSQDPGSGRLHRFLGGEVWRVTCAGTQASWWRQQQS